MSDSTMLLAVFEEIEPAVKGIEKLHELGVSDEQMNVISGIPIKEAILGRPSAVELRIAHCAWPGPSSECCLDYS